jgi:hypothetical protein
MCFTAACVMSTKGFSSAPERRVDPFWVIEHVSLFHPLRVAFFALALGGVDPRAARV